MFPFVRQDEWVEACRFDRFEFGFYLDLPKPTTRLATAFLPEIDEFDLVDLFDLLDPSTCTVIYRKEKSVSITSEVMVHIDAGVQHFDELVALTGYKHGQIYSVVRELVKNNKATMPVGGHHGIIVLNGQRYIPKQQEQAPVENRSVLAAIPASDGLGNVINFIGSANTPSDPITEEIKSLMKKVVPSLSVVEKPIAEKPVVEKPIHQVKTIMSPFDFNAHFDTFINTMVGVVVGEIQQRVEKEMVKIESDLGNKISETVRSSSEGIIGRVSNQLTQAMNAVQSIQSNLGMQSAILPQEPAQTETVQQTVVGQQPPKVPEVEATKVRLPKICITNLLPVQCGQLMTEFSDTFDIIFWNDRTGSSMDQLRDYSQNCEAVFWHTKHGSHSSEKMARKHNSNVIRVPGDLTSMRNALTTYYCEQTKTA